MFKWLPKLLSIALADSKSRMDDLSTTAGWFVMKKWYQKNFLILIQPLVLCLYDTYYVNCCKLRTETELNKQNNVIEIYLNTKKTN